MSLDFIKKNVTYDEQALDLVIDLFKDKEVYNKFIATIVDVQKDYETLLVDLAEARRLPLATGKNLTDIGDTLGLIRTTEDDNDFRAAIYLSSIRRNSNGTRDTIVQGLLQATGEIPYLYSGLLRTVEINVNGEILPSQETINEIIGLLPLNTAYEVGKTPVQAAPFGFDGDSTSAGFGSVSQNDTANVGGFTSLRAYVGNLVSNDPSSLPYVALGYVYEGYVD